MPAMSEHLKQCAMTEFLTAEKVNASGFCQHLKASSVLLTSYCDQWKASKEVDYCTLKSIHDRFHGNSQKRTNNNEKNVVNNFQGIIVKKREVTSFSML